MGILAGMTKSLKVRGSLPIRWLRDTIPLCKRPFIDHSCKVRNCLNIHVLAADFAALLLKGGRFA